MRRLRCSRGLAPLLVAISANLAFADGCMMPRQLGAATRLVQSPKQEAMLITDGQRVQVILRTHFEKGTEELAWVVPVPARPTEIRAQDDAVFDELDQRTAPRFMLTGSKPAFFGCGCAAAPADAVVPARLQVHETGTAGMFDYAVLSAAERQSLLEWLKRNDYMIPRGAENTFDRYVKSGSYWLAMKVRTEDRSHATLAPHPISYTYENNRVVFPLAISRISASPQNEIVLYVLSSGRYACSNWSNAAIDRNLLREEPDALSGTNYERVFMSMANADAHLFVTEFAVATETVPKFQPNVPVGEHPYLTRLRGVLDPAAMDRDVILVPVSGWGDVNNEHYVRPYRERASAGFAIGALLALTGGAWLFRKPGCCRVAGSALLIVAVVALGA